MNHMEDVDFYLHCRNCIIEGKKDNIEAGRTKCGLKLWCKTHQELIAFIPVEWPDSPKCGCCNK